MLSGFILTYNYDSRLTSPQQRKEYFVARFARIYPVCLLGLAIAAIPVYLLLRSHAPMRIWNAHHAGDNPILGILLSLVIQLLCLSAWFQIPVSSSIWNAPSWSISCEAFYYACFPNFLKRLKQLSIPRLAALMLVLWIIQGLWIWGLNHYLPDMRTFGVIYQNPISHLFEFLAGIAAGLCFLRLPVHQAQRLSPGGFAASILAIFALSYFQPVWPAFYPLTWAFALLIFSLAPPGPISKWLCLSPLVLLGEASYSLYMIHVPLFRIFQFCKLGGWAAATSVLGTIFLSVIVFRFFEEPLRGAVRGNLLSKYPTG